MRFVTKGITPLSSSSDELFPDCSLHCAELIESYDKHLWDMCVFLCECVLGMRRVAGACACDDEPLA